MSSNEYHRQYQNERYKVRMAAAVQTLGGKCVQCGSVTALEFDHIDPATKLYNITDMKNHSQELFDAELAKCQLLCIDCHRKKSHPDSDKLIHGTWNALRKKCKCDICKAFRANHQRKYRATIGQ